MLNSWLHRDLAEQFAFNRNLSCGSIPPNSKAKGFRNKAKRNQCPTVFQPHRFRNRHFLYDVAWVSDYGDNTGTNRKIDIRPLSGL